MRTIDTNLEAKLALVQDTDKWSDPEANTRYIPMAQSPALATSDIPQTYLRQLHYVASHIAAGLFVHDRRINGELVPKSGWTRWKP